MAPLSKQQNANDNAKPAKPASGDSKSNTPQITSNVTGWLKSKDLQPPT